MEPQPGCALQLRALKTLRGHSGGTRALCWTLPLGSHTSRSGAPSGSAEGHASGEDDVIGGACTLLTGGDDQTVRRWEVDHPCLAAAAAAETSVALPAEATKPPTMVVDAAPDSSIKGLLASTATAYAAAESEVPTLEHEQAVHMSPATAAAERPSLQYEDPTLERSQSSGSITTAADSDQAPVGPARRVCALQQRVPSLADGMSDAPPVASPTSTAGHAESAAATPRDQGAVSRSCLSSEVTQQQQQQNSYQIQSFADLGRGIPANDDFGPRSSNMSSLPPSATSAEAAQAVAPIETAAAAAALDAVPPLAYRSAAGTVTLTAASLAAQGVPQTGLVPSPRSAQRDTSPQRHASSQESLSHKSISQVSGQSTVYKHQSSLHVPGGSSTLPPSATSAEAAQAVAPLDTPAAAAALNAQPPREYRAAAGAVTAIAAVRAAHGVPQTALCSGRSNDAVSEAAVQAHTLSEAPSLSQAPSLAGLDAAADRSAEQSVQQMPGQTPVAPPSGGAGGGTSGGTISTAGRRVRQVRALSLGGDPLLPQPRLPHGAPEAALDACLRLAGD